MYAVVREGRSRHGRTNAKSTYNPDANPTRNPIQEAVPCAWNFTDALHVVIWRQSLLYHHIGEGSARKL